MARACRGRASLRLPVAAAAIAFAALAGWQYAAPRRVELAAPAVATVVGGRPLEVRVQRNMGAAEPFVVAGDEGAARLLVHRPEELGQAWPAVAEALAAAGIGEVSDSALVLRAVSSAVRPPLLELVEDRAAAPYRVEAAAGGVTVRVADLGRYPELRADLLTEVRQTPAFALLPAGTLDELFARGARRPFLLAFVALLLGAAFAIVAVRGRFDAAGRGRRAAFIVVTAAALAAVLWLLPGLSLFARILSSVIASTVLSLYLIDLGDLRRFADNARFLLLIFLYSGFWVLYFQMFDSVLWYVQAYVDASSLDRAVNAVLAALGLPAAFRFDVEHVTVVNAGTIILLQLVVSSIVAKTRALPTMIFGIGMATVGMAILALSTDIWVFMAGIMIFSLGEMTAHPKLISFVGTIAPRDRVATYMGYIFLYGVIGSSIGAVVGARLYVQLVDNLNQPRLLWLIFASIGVATAVALALYSRLVGTLRREPEEAQG